MRPQERPVVTRRCSQAFGATDLGPPGHDNQFGHGRVELMRAVEGNPIDVTIQGPPTVRPGTTCYYSMTQTGGTGPFDYEWYKDSTLIGTTTHALVNTGSTDFQLSMHVEDSFQNGGVDQIQINLDPWAPDCDL